MKTKRKVGRPKKRKYVRRNVNVLPVATEENSTPIEETTPERQNRLTAADYKRIAFELWDIIDDVALFTESCYDENKAIISPFFRKKFAKRFDYFVRVAGKITPTENILVKK